MFRENYSKYNELLKQQKSTWNTFSSGWKKWDDLLMSSMKPVGDALIDTLHITGFERVLDMASGTGEPGLSLCKRLPSGRVYGVDLSEEMVAIAVENSKKMGLTNYNGVVSNAAKLPFDNNYFDHVICRFGVMFFPDIPAGLRELKRVLKPGGTMSLAVWATPEFNPFISVMGMVVAQKLGLQAPPLDSPGIFRCAQPGYTSLLLKASGINHVIEKNIRGMASFESPEQYWDVMTDVAGPIMQAMQSASTEVVDEIRQSVLQEISVFESDKSIEADWEAIVAYGNK